MKSICIFPALLLFLLASCKSENPTTANGGPTVFLNSSFESTGTPSSDGWTISSSPMGGFATDVPTNGGNYSIFLQASNPGGSATINIALPFGVHLFRFSVWAKTGSVAGHADLVYVPSVGQSMRLYQIDVPDTTWRQYSIVDSLPSQTGDSIKVVLSAGFSELIFSRTYFDLCKLEQIQ
jgi:hypothetical protein